MSELLQRISDTLGSSVEELRYRGALQLFAKFQPPPANLVIKVLGDSSWRVRKLAVEKLSAETIDDETLRAIVDALADQDNAGLRNAAAEVLLKVGRPAVGYLLELMDRGGEDERKFAAEILGAIGSPEAFDSLRNLLGDEDENVRAAAAEALGRLGRPEAAKDLVDLLGRDGMMVKLSCLAALDELGVGVEPDVLLDLCERGPLRPHLYRLMGRCQDQKVLEQLLKGLMARGRTEMAAAAGALVELADNIDPQGRVEIQVEVARQGQRLVDKLYQIFEGGSQREREAAVVLAGWTGSEDVVDLLLDAAEQPALYQLAKASLVGLGEKVFHRLRKSYEEGGESRRVLILELIGEMPSSTGDDLLLDALLEPEPVCQVAVEVLAKRAGSRAVERLVAMLKSEFATRRDILVRALIKVGSRFQDMVIGELRQLLSSNMPELRRAAAEVSCALARQNDVPTLIQLASDGDPHVRAAAVSALGTVADTETAVDRLRVVLADEDASVRLAAVRALQGHEGQDVSKLLLASLHDPDELVVREALIGIGKLENGVLVDRVSSFVGHPNGLVATAAVRACAQLSPEGQDWLDKAMEHPDPEVAREAMAACENRPPDEVRGLLERGLKHRNWAVRLQAVKTIGKTGDAYLLEIMRQHLPSERHEWVRHNIESLLEDHGACPK